MSRLRKTLIIAPLAVMAVAAGFWVWRARWYRVRIEEEIALLRKEGGSASVADLAPRPGVDGVTHYIDFGGLGFTGPDVVPGVAGQSEADSQTRIAARNDSFLSWNGESFTPRGGGRPWNDKWLPVLEKYVSDNADALKRVKEEAAEGNGCFENDWGQGAAPIPHNALLRAARRALSAEAILKARRGDAAGAFEDVRLLLRLRRLFDREPLLLAWLVAAAMDSMATGTLHGVLEFCPPDRAGARAILEELEGREQRNDLARALVGDTAFFFEALGRSGAGAFVADAPGGGRMAELGEWTQRRFCNTMAVRYHYLVMMRELRGHARMSVAERRAAGIQAPSATGLGPRALVARAFMSNIYGSLKIEARANCWAVRARTALAVEMYKAEEGKYPEALDAVVPGYLKVMPVDPYDGKAMRYRAGGDGFAVWSVGPDGVDSGGEGDDMAWSRQPAAATPAGPLSPPATDPAGSAVEADCPG